MKSQLRTFVAVPVPSEVGRKVSRIIKKLELEIGRVRWTASMNYHCTLAFLGDVDTVEIPDLCRAVAESVQEMKPFEVLWSGVGGFPNLAKPRVLWLGTKVGTEPMKTLAQAVEDALVPLGYRPPHRGFTPHLTLGRGPRHGPALEDVRELMQGFPRQEAGRHLVEKVNVYSSDLTPNGPVYTVLATVELNRG